MTLLGLPIYLCHKKVGAAKITAITPKENGAVLTLDGGPQIHVDAAWLQRNPAVAAGGYFVQYIQNPDGYTAYSPAQPFEEGYSSVVSLGEDLSDEIDAADNMIDGTITDVKLLLSQIETTAVNEPHAVKDLCGQAASKLDALDIFFNPPQTTVDMKLGQPTFPANAAPASPPATGPVPETPYPADQTEPTEQAPDTQQEQTVSQPEAQTAEATQQAAEQITTGGEAQAPA